MTGNLTTQQFVLKTAGKLDTDIPIKYLVSAWSVRAIPLKMTWEWFVRNQLTCWGKGVYKKFNVEGFRVGVQKQLDVGWRGGLQKWMLGEGVWDRNLQPATPSHCNLTLSCPGTWRAVLKIGHSNFWPGSKELNSPRVIQTKWHQSFNIKSLSITISYAVGINIFHIL